MEAMPLVATLETRQSKSGNSYQVIVIKLTENYEKLVDHATEIRIASDYLTEQVRYYVVRGSENYLENYLNEVSSLRREKAIEEIRVYYNGNFNGYYNLLYAVNRSKELMNNEYYAIRLRIEADGKEKI